MCGSKMAVDAAEPTNLTQRRSSHTTRSSPPTPRKQAESDRVQTPKLKPLVSDPSSSAATSSANFSSGSSYRIDTSVATTSAAWSRTSLSSLRESLPDNPHIYDFSEIRSATNNFLSKRHSSASSSQSWRCTLRRRDTVVFQRKFRLAIKTEELRDKLHIICRAHHTSIVKLLGASISGEHIYLVYEYVNGGSLSDCLRNPRNNEFTVLSTWMSRMQIATDLADALDYIHNNSGHDINLVHKHVKSSSVIVTEPKFNAKICHFGTTELCGESVAEEVRVPKVGDHGEIEEVVSPESPAKIKRSDSRSRPFEGVRGYMSPEFQAIGVATQKSDVFAFGIVILELLSGEEPLKYKFDRQSGDYRKISVIETARNALDGGGEGEGLDGRLRRWIDRRLRDSFPVVVAEKLTRVAIECVHVDPDKRPNMSRVAGKISKLYLESKKWSETVNVPTEFSVSFAPR